MSYIERRTQCSVCSCPKEKCKNFNNKIPTNHRIVAMWHVERCKRMVQRTTSNNRTMCGKSERRGQPTICVKLPSPNHNVQPWKLVVQQCGKCNNQPNWWQHNKQPIFGTTTGVSVEKTVCVSNRRTLVEDGPVVLLKRSIATVTWKAQYNVHTKPSGSVTGNWVIRTSGITTTNAKSKQLPNPTV